MKEKAPGIGVINLLQLHYVKEPRLYIIITLTREQEKDSSNSKYNKLKHYHDEKKRHTSDCSDSKDHRVFTSN